MDHQDVTEALRRLLGDILPPGTPVETDTPLRASGLSSMMAARLWLEIQETFGVDTPLTWLAGEASLSELAGRVLAQSRSGGARPVAAPRDTDDRLAAYPLTPMQESYLVGTHPDLTADPVGCQQ